MTDHSQFSRPLAVPAGRLSRMGRMGSLTAGVAGRMAVDGLRQWAQGDRPAARDLLLTPTNMRRIADELARMRGAAMKLGQLVSMDTGDVLPPELSEIFARLRADADFMPPKQLRDVLDAEWGAGWRKRFAQFDVRPIAAASIGQVHRAKLPDGTDLAIKVQYPGIARSIDSDVANIGRLIRMSGLLPDGFELGPYLDEARAQLKEEADYLREGAFMKRFGEVLAGDDRFVVPTFEEELTTPDVLAMSFERGQPIDELAEADQATRNEVITNLFDLVIRELFEFKVMQTDPNFANYRYRPETKQIVLLDFGASRDIEPELSAGYRRLVEADLSGDWAAIDEAARAINLYSGDLTANQEDALKEIFLASIEPLQKDEEYDFAASEVTMRMRDGGIKLREDPFQHTPNPIALFLHRKIGGMYLLATRLGAKVNVRALLRQHGFA